MRIKFVVAVVAFFMSVAVVLAAIIIVSGLGPSVANGLQVGISGATVVRENAITRENANPGTDNWQIPQGKESTIQLQAYADATSVAPGQTLTFYVSTLKEGAPYWVDIYRIGWYGGTGGRLMSSLPEQIGHTQGYYDVLTKRLVGCLSCLVNAKIGLVEANWQPSFKLTVPPGWTTGVYLAKLTDAGGLQTYVPFDVRGNFHSLYLALTPETTYAAYNDWGGYSIDDAATEGQNAPATSAVILTKAVKVSFDRPYTQEAGSSQVLIFEADAIHWFERQGYDLSYISSVDLHEDPAQLQQHRAYLSLGHDEYWSDRMRDGIEIARDKGVGLAFLGADAGYWQIRFETDSLNKPDRTIVCYKVSTVENDLALDPMYGKDNKRVTARWRDPVIGRPENELIGIMFSDLTHQQLGFPWQLSLPANSALLDGTGLQPGQQYGCGLVGYEWDRFFSNGASPGDLQVIGASSTRNDTYKSDVSNTTYYISSSGAMVFATGSIYWTTALDSYRLHTDNLCAYQPTVVPGMQKLMENVMNALIVHHPLGSLTSILSPSATPVKVAAYAGVRTSFSNLILWADDDWMNTINRYTRSRRKF